MSSRPVRTKRQTSLLAAFSGKGSSESTINNDKKESPKKILTKRKRSPSPKKKTKSPPRKRAKRKISDDEEDFQPPNKIEEEDELEEDVVSEDDLMAEDPDDDDDDDFVKPKSKAKLPTPKLTKLPTTKAASPRSPRKTPVKKQTTPKATPAATIKSPTKARAKAQDDTRYEWLENIRDKNMRTKDDPLYNPRTLYVPKSAYDKLSPFEQQFWDVKSEHFDTVVFFKKGKFYELYEMDADVGNREFDLKMTDRVNMRMVGVPESSIRTWASKFLARGYKITQVDQVETAIGMSRRVKSTNSATKDKKKKVDKVIRREVSRILTQGTLMDEGFIADFQSHYLLSIKEEIQDLDNPSHSNETINNFVKYGVCLMDCCVGKVSFATFFDDAKRTQLQTLLVQTNPKEIIFEKGNISQFTERVITTRLNEPTRNYLEPGKEVLSAADTLKELTKYKFSIDKLPAVVQLYKDDICMSAFGACLSYLASLKIADSLIPHCTFEKYNSNDERKYLVLDGQALINLEVLESNLESNSRVGSLFDFMDHCHTNFGKRLLKSWICTPLYNIQDINNRLESVEWLMKMPELLADIKKSFSKLPDLERFVSRISAAHQVKVSDFVSLLQGIIDVNNFYHRVNSLYHSKDCPTLISELLEISDDEQSNSFPVLDDVLNQHFSFDMERTKKDNFIEPQKGQDETYDAAQNAVADIHKKLQDHLKKQSKSLGVPMQFMHMQKDKFQMEISQKDLESITLPDDFQLVTKTQNVGRYYNAFVIATLKDLANAEEDLTVAKAGIFQRYVEKFNTWQSLWNRMVRCIANVDCLASLAITSSKTSGPMSKPQFIESEGCYFDIKEMRHPILCDKIIDGFISNSISLGTKEQPARVTLLTGPNMGGKSTLLRQLCLIVIMAQVGCYVPAASCVMSLTDRIFTRLGASDNIMMGQSTFMVELQETSTVLHEATDHSLIILDELGRGTSTFDGYSIAYATLAHLSATLKAAILFSTHYHALTVEFEADNNVALRHMACHIDDENQEVVFLYHLQEGVCPRSYGMNVAVAAGLPKEIIERAHVVAKNFEESQFKEGSKDINA